MQPSLVPHFKASEISLMDRLHGEPYGLLAEEGHCLVFSMVRIKGWCTPDDINAAMTAYNWPPGHRPPNVHPSALKGTKGTLPASGTSLRYTAFRNASLGQTQRSLPASSGERPTSCFLAVVGATCFLLWNSYFSTKLPSRTFSNWT
eukprot:1207354-Pleurochrysis_carterae.AAC.1